MDFSPRGIDLTSFPYNAWRKVTRATLMDDDKEMFLTGRPRGSRDCGRPSVDIFTPARGVNCTADQIIIGAGSEYLMMLLTQILGTSRTIAHGKSPPTVSVPGI